ncbi:MAK10-like protein, partial [Tanacetum coccineum]
GLLAGMHDLFSGRNCCLARRIICGYPWPELEGKRFASNWLERLPAGSISTLEDLTTRFLAQFFPPGRTAKLCNDILMFQQHHGESLSEAWTRFKDLLQKVPHHGIDLWLQVQIFYEHVNPITRRTIDQLAGGKLRDLNPEESWAILEDLSLYDNESWNDLRDFAKPVKAIALPQDVPSTSDRRLIELKNQVQRLMEAHLAPTQPTQVNKMTTSCEICSGPHDTQYCMEDPEQAFVEYASSRTDEAGDKYVESLELGKNGSAFVQGETPVKIEDPGLFTLPCRLGDSKPFDTLADLGLCVNIIPLYLFKKLNIGLLKETDHIFGLADGTKSYPAKAIALPQDVPSTSDLRLIELENQVQRLMEAHLAPTQPTQVNKIATPCEICSGPHNTQCCMENPEQAFVEYASSRTDKAGEGLVSEFMATQDTRLSRFEADFKQQQSEMTNKIDTVLKAITDRIVGTLR